MATLTIKIESEELAREVLAHLGYLPEDDIPELVTHEEVSDPEHIEKENDSPIVDAFKTWSGVKNLPLPKNSTEEHTEGVQPADNDLGASLEVYSDETDKERDEIFKQCMEVRKTLPSAKDRLATQIDGIMERCERLDYLATMADNDDKEMREAVKAYVIKEYTGKDLKFWPALHKILENARVQ